MTVTILVQKGWQGDFTNFVNAWRYAIRELDPFLTESRIPLDLVTMIIKERE